MIKYYCDVCEEETDDSSIIFQTRFYPVQGKNRRFNAFGGSGCNNKIFLCAKHREKFSKGLGNNLIMDAIIEVLKDTKCEK